MVVNATVVWDVNCSFSCGAECWKSSRYPCLQVYVSLNSSGRVVRLSHNEETQDRNPEVRKDRGQRRGSGLLGTGPAQERRLALDTQYRYFII